MTAPAIVTITGADGAIIAPDWLARAESVHRQLRTQLPADYVGTLKRVFAGGARMCVAARGERVVGVAVYRIHENTFEGMKMYVDDLVTDEHERSTGVGRALMMQLQDIARAEKCANYTLDSGTQRTRAHAFYFREGMFVTSFHFVKKLK